MRQTNNIQKLRRLIAALLVIMVMVASVPAAYADEMSGSCGDSLSWSFSEGTLTVEGSGEMSDYGDSSPAPWSGLRDQVTRLVLPEGLTSIGDMAFYHFTRLTSVDVPSTVTRIGEYAFAGCSKLAMLDLGDGLSTIGDGAFYSCKSIVSLRLPESLIRIGMDTFYSCHSLTAITVPANVNTIGPAAFAYCTSLVRVELKNSVTSLPDWAFFGCKQLTTVILPETVQSMGNAVFRDCDNLYYVSYGGDEVSREAMEESIAQDVPNFDTTGFLTSDRPNDTTISSSAVDNPDGTVTMQSTSVTETENATVSSTVEQIIGAQQGSVSTQIIVTVENDSGWDEVVETVDRAVSDSIQQTGADGVSDTKVTVYIKDSETVDTEFMDTLAGRDVAVNVVTKDGSSWSVDCGQMDIRNPSESYDLRYSLLGAPAEICTQMAVSQGYLLKFTAKTAVNAELKIQLPQELARQTATLFHQENRRTLVLHQSVVIDADGCAHFYLGEVSNEVDYFIGINVPGTQEEAIIPQSMQSEYGIDYAEPIQYVITGRESSWGIGIGTVTWILAAVMLGTVAGVGVVMYALNKRRLKMGYIPDTSEEE